jgi:O-antigen/teichoic acid export membrane protein
MFSTVRLAILWPANFPLITDKGNTTYAGALAAVMANVVLVAYIILAFQDDQAEQREEEEKRKKSS